MKKQLLFLSLVLSVLSVKTVVSQTWVEKMQDPSVNFYDVQQSFNNYFTGDKLRELRREQKHERREMNELREKEEEALRSGKPLKSVHPTGKEEERGEVPNFELYKRWEDYMRIRLYPSGDRSVMTNAWNDYLDNYYSAQNQNTNNQRSMSGAGTPTTQAANWTIIGPTTTIPSGGGAGRVNFVRFDPTNSSTMYVGSPAGGLWKSTTGGTGWATNTDNLAVIGCTDLAINPSNTQIMYLATGDGEAQDTYSIGVLKSTNGGTTWASTGLNWTVTNLRSISKLLMNPQNPNTLLAATSNGVYRTINAGTSWTQIATALANIKDIEYRPGDTTTVYACSTTKFYKSTNGGTTFTNITSGLPATTAVSRLSIGVTASDPTYVYVVAAIAGTGSANDYGFQGIYRSVDNGTTFTTRATTPNLLGFAAAGNDQGGQGWYTLSIAVSPINKDLVLVGGVNIWKSIDGGANWTLNAQWTGSGAPYVHADIHALEFLPGSGTTYFAGCDGGCFKTANTGTAWSDLSNGLQISEAYKLGCSATNNNLIVSGLQDNGTVRYNGTTTWSYIQGGDGMEAAIDWSNANVQYGELYYGQINRTTTGGGLNTSIVSSGGTGVNADGDWVTPYILNPQKASTLVVGKAQAYRSRNRGTAWAALGTVTGGTGNINALAYAPTDSNYLYMSKIDKFYVSTNSGTSFVDRTGTLPVASAAITYIAVAGNNAQHVWVTFSGYSAANKVWYSADAGVTWTNYSTGLPNLPANCIVYQNTSTNDALYVGTDVGVYYRDNTAGSWVAYNTGLPNVIVKELEIQYGSSKLRAATFGRGLWQTDLNTPGTAAPVADFTASKVNICVGDCINFTDASTGTPTSWSWSFTGAATTTSTLQNPTNICYNTAGTYAVTLIATNANGSNTMTKTAYITVNGVSALPLVEGFQGTYVPAGWFLNNPDADNTWAQVTNAGGFGTSTSSVMMDSYSPTTTIAGTIDELYTPKYSFAGLATATLKFDVAYARYNGTYTDSLSVFVSTNCGSTWTSLYAKGGYTGLQTAPDNGTSLFVPTATQWRTETISLTPYVGQANVMVKFQSRSGYGQAMYLDNINISGTGGTVAGVSIAETTGTNPVCAGTSVTFTATPTNGGTAPSYQWQVNGANVGTNSTTYTTSALTNGQSVTCIMTSNLSGVTGNPATSNAIVMTVNAIPAAPTASSNSPVCSGSAINLTASTVTGATYSWTGPTYTSTTQNPSRAASTIAMAGTYSVTATVNGCPSVAGTTTVVVNPKPVLTITNPAAVCSPSTVDLTVVAVTAGSTGSGTLTYWTNAAATTSLTTPAAVTTSGTYYIKSTTAGGCTDVKPVTITINPVPVSTFTQSADQCLSGNSFDFTNTGGTGTYSWTFAGGTPSSSTTNNQAAVTFATAGAHTITHVVTSAAGCSSTSTATVNVFSAPSAQASTTTNASCGSTNGSILLGATTGGTSPYTYSVDGSGFTTTTSYTGLASGNHSVIVKDANGCQFTTSVNVQNSNGPTALATTANNSTCDGTDGSITIGTATGGTGPYSYSVNGGTYSTSTNITGLIAGSYSVTVKDANGCTFSTNATVGNTGTTPATPTITQSGSTLTSSSATGNQWYLDGSAIPGATSQNYTYTVNGNYTVIVTTGTCSSASSAPTTVINVGIGTVENFNSLLVYPNPTDGNFILSFSSNEKMNYKVEIFNSLGQVVYTEDIKDFTGVYSKQLSIVEYGTGIYTVNLTNSKNQTVKKIIVY